MESYRLCRVSTPKMVVVWRRGVVLCHQSSFLTYVYLWHIEQVMIEETMMIKGESSINASISMVMVQLQKRVFLYLMDIKQQGGE